MCAASIISRSAGKQTVFNGQTEQIASTSRHQTEAVDSGRELAFSRVVVALHKTFQFVTGTAPTHDNKKRKITEEDSAPSIAKKAKTDFEECVSKNDNDKDNDCSICLAPWSACGDHRLTSLKCGHLFGRSCIVRWIEDAHSCPYCCARAEVTDLRNIFAQKIKAEDTTNKDLAIELFMMEKAARRDLKWQLARQIADTENLRLELNQLKRQSAGRTGYFSGGFGIVAALTAVKDSLSRRLSRVFRRRYRTNRSQVEMSQHTDQCEMAAVDVNPGVNRQTE